MTSHTQSVATRRHVARAVLCGLLLFGAFGLIAVCCATP